MNITITDHVVERVKERAKSKGTNSRAKYFILVLFERLLRLYNNNERYKLRKIHKNWQGNNTFKLTDGRHTFVAKKDFGEVKIITYYKDTISER